ncbi:MAG TPA: Gfo/Idh/MocA family oxidoreductase [Candidatus Binatia bacterium]|jgi:predicted dehydrogenase
MNSQESEVDFPIPAELPTVLQVPKRTGDGQPQATRMLGLGRLKIGVIGYGYWGPNLVRNFAEVDGVEIKWCADKMAERRALVKKRYPFVNTAESADAILGDPEVGAVVIATPVTSHYLLVKRALERGKHVLVEKPMTQTVQEAEELLELADKKGLVLMVDHTFIFTGAVRKMKEILEDGKLGELYYFDSVRVNLGKFQRDIDVLWDLGPHDLSILTYLVHEAPKYVSATGADHTNSGLMDVVYMTVHYPNNFLAHLHVNWLSPVKIRQMLFGGSRRMLVYNDMEPSEKVRVYDRGIRVTTQESIYNTLIDYRMGDVWAPKLDNREALSIECEHFVECVRFNTIPRTNAAAGLTVVRLLEAASKSLGAGGARIKV